MKTPTKRIRNNDKFIFALGLLVTLAVSVFAQDAAKEKEIDRLFDSGDKNANEQEYDAAIADFKKVLVLDDAIANA